VENALYWIEEIGMDGLRLDAVHAHGDRLAALVPFEAQKLAAAVLASPARPAGTREPAP
jgi:1,4-alpha-glucan branching enzyme